MNEYTVQLHPLSRLSIYQTIKADSYRLEDAHFNFYTDGKLTATLKQEEILGILLKSSNTY